MLGVVVMRGIRPALAVVTVCSVAFAPATGAKPSRPACPLMVDPQGDTGHQNTSIGDDPALDFVSADVASNRTHLTVVMRFAQLAMPPAGSPGGAMYDYAITVNGTEFVLVAAYRTGIGAEFRLRTRQWTTVGPVGPVGPIEVFRLTTVEARVDGVFDEDRSEIRMTVAIADMPGVRPGHKVTDFRLMSWMYAGDVGASTDGIRLSNRPYVIGSRSCVAVGT